MRGLIATQKTAHSQDLQKLVQEYSSGFNSNMCETIVNMSDNKSSRLEYSVIWSPKIQPAQDLASFDPILLTQVNYHYLEAASAELRQLEPESVIVRGLITDLSSKDNPLGTETKRSVVIKWLNRAEGRPVNVLASLEKDDYILANEAHINWSTIQVTGIINKIGNIWRLSDPHNFEIQH